MAHFTAVQFGSDLCLRAKAGWRATARGTIPRLVIGLAIAFAVCLGITVAITLWARSIAEDGLAAWDREQIVHLRDGTGWAGSVPMSFTNGIVLESYSNIAILLPLTLIGSGVMLWRGRIAWAVAFLASYLLARLLIWTGWHLWDRERPDLIEGGAAALSAHSFPSGHSLLTFTAYGLFAYLWAASSRSWIERAFALALLILLATAVSLARLRLGAHWPSDCIAGGFIGMLWLTGVILATRYAERQLLR